MAELQLSKLDAARRQIESAIRLYFHEGDPVAIHTLVAAGYELLRDLNKHRGGEPMFFKDRFLDHIVPEMRPEFVRVVNEAENFFKHADRDPEKMLIFNPQQSELLLLDACEKYLELTSERLPLLRVFQLWSWLTWANTAIVDREEFERAAAPVRKYLTSTGSARQAFFNSILPLAYANGAEQV